LDVVERTAKHEMLRCDGISLDAARAKFVLWVFGAFEIVRTVSSRDRFFANAAPFPIALNLPDMG
jgi:hypothetical protein